MELKQVVIPELQKKEDLKLRAAKRLEKLYQNFGNFAVERRLRSRSNQPDYGEN
jgi:hypothetical protein